MIETSLKLVDNYSHSILDEIKKTLETLDNISGFSLGIRNPIIINPDWKNILNLCSNFLKEKDLKDRMNLLLFTTKEDGFELEEFFNSFQHISDISRIMIDISKGLSKKTKDFIKSNEESEKAFKISLCIVVNKDTNDNIENIIKDTKTFMKEYDIEPDICLDRFSDSTYSINIKRHINMNNLISNASDYNLLIKSLKNEFNIKLSDEDREFCEDLFKRRPCRYLFENPYCFKEKTTTCIRDKEFRQGYLHEKETSESLRLKTSHIAGLFDKIDICSICPEYDALSDKEVLDFLKKNNAEELFANYKNRIKKGYFFEIYKNRDLEQYLVYPESELLKKAGLLEHKEKHQEDDFCCAWTRILKKEDGKLYSGCKGSKIVIDDYIEFCKRLSIQDYSNIPDSCFYCKKKFSLDQVHDRKYHYRFATDDFFLPDIKTKDNIIINTAIDTLTKKGMQDSITPLLTKINRYTKWRYFILKIKSKKLLEKAYDVNSFLLYLFILLNSNFKKDKLPDVLINTKFKRIPFLKTAVSILLKYSKHIELKKFKNTFDYIIESEHYRNFLLNEMRTSSFNIKDILENIKKNELITKANFDLLLNEEALILILYEEFLRSNDPDIFWKFLKDKVLPFNALKKIKKELLDSDNFFKNTDIKILYSLFLNISISHEDIQKIFNKLKKDKENFDKLGKINLFLFEKGKISALESIVSKKIEKKRLDLNTLKRLFPIKCIEDTLIYFHFEKTDKATKEHIYFESLKNFDIFSEKYRNIILEKTRNILSERIKERKYFSIIRILKIFKNLDYKTINLLEKEFLSIDFSDYTFSYIRFLILINKYFPDFNKDKIFYNIFSFYMDRKTFDKAKYFFDKIEDKSLFWNSSEIKKTSDFLNNKKRSFLKRFVSKIKPS